MIKDFSSKFPSENIIVRPHPTEKIEYWEKELKDFKNVLIKVDGNLSRYIVNSECVIQNGCTSAVEAFISSIPVINYLPVESKSNVFGTFNNRFAVIVKKKRIF